MWGGLLSHLSLRHPGNPLLGHFRLSKGGKQLEDQQAAAAILGPTATMASWALSAALLCLGGAFAYSELHSLSRSEEHTSELQSLS